MTWDILVGLFLGTAASGIVPVINAELLVIGAVAAAGGGAVPLIALVSTVGQMITKTVLYVLARIAPDKLPERARRALERASGTVSANGAAAGTVVFTSASVGLPPFYGVAIVCGVVRMSAWTFLLTGTAGRFVRFGVIAWAAATYGDDALDLIAAVFVPGAVAL